MKKMILQGVLDTEKADPFDLFVGTGGVSYCLYRDSERILGNTFGMCILQVTEKFYISINYLKQIDYLFPLFIPSYVIVIFGKILFFSSTMF